jgi:hypothetical protein
MVIKAANRVDKKRSYLAIWRWVIQLFGYWNRVVAIEPGYQDIRTESIAKSPNSSITK